MSEWKKVKLGDCCEITSSKKQDRGQVTVPQEYSKNIISNVTKNEEARHGPDPCLLMSPAPQSLELRAVDRAWRMTKARRSD